LIDDAKRQASRIVSVSGQTPVTHSACVASLWEDPIKVILADPPPHGDATLDFSGDRFWKNYYGAIGGYIRDFRASSDFARPFRGYAFASLEHLFSDLPNEKIPEMAPLPTVIGLPEGIVENPGTAPAVFDQTDAERMPIKGDGILLLGPFGSPEKLKGRS